MLKKYNLTEIKEKVSELVYGFYHNDKNSITSITGKNNANKVSHIFIRSDNDIEVNCYKSYDYEEEDGVHLLNSSIVEMHQEVPSDEEVQKQIVYIIELSGYTLKKYKISILNGTYYIHDQDELENIVINEEVFRSELVDYKIVDKECEINNIIRFIAESKSESDKNMMKSDLKDLIKSQDSFVFSSTSCNEYVDRVNDEKRFSEICEEIIKVNKSLIQ